MPRVVGWHVRRVVSNAGIHPSENVSAIDPSAGLELVEPVELPTLPPAAPAAPLVEKREPQQRPAGTSRSGWASR